MKFVLQLWPDLDEETPEALLAYAVASIQDTPGLVWDILDDQDNPVAENVTLS